jgi:hypothetical protein
MVMMDIRKKCTSCKDDKFLSDFNKNKSKKDGYNNICRVCSNKRSKKYYHDNVEHHKVVIGVRRKKEVLINRQNLYNYYLEHPCVDCNENDPIVLESDHKDDANKINNVSNMVYQNSWGTILIELEKCETRCANCHRRRTAKQFDWYKDLNK